MCTGGEQAAEVGEEDWAEQHNSMNKNTLQPDFILVSSSQLTWQWEKKQYHWLCAEYTQSQLWAHYSKVGR